MRIDGTTTVVGITLVVVEVDLSVLVDVMSDGMVIGDVTRL